MKIILFVITVCLYAWPTQAYIEVTRPDETQSTAGDQNSAKHRLSDKSSEVLKKLKQADEYVTRVRAVGQAVNAENLESLLISDKEDKTRQDLKRMTTDTEMKARSPRMLVTQTDPAVYAALFSMRTAQVKDAQVAAELQQQLRGRAR